MKRLLFMGNTPTRASTIPMVRADGPELTMPKTTPTVSIITIFLNAEEFIEEAIDSVLMQSYSHWELILVDDGSTDASTQIARRYAERHPDRVRYLTHPGHQNRGMSASRNCGLRHARGAYITFLDADDVWLPDKLDQQVALLESHPEAGMLCGASQYWYGWTGRPEDAVRDRIVAVGAPQDALTRPPALLTLLYPLGKGVSPCVNSLLIRRHIVEAVNGFEEGFRGMYEDQAFLTKIYLHCPVMISSLCLDRYRQHANSCMSTMFREGGYRHVRKNFLTWFEKYLLEQGEEDSQVWHALQEALKPYRHPIRFFLVELRKHPLGRFKRLAWGFVLRRLTASRDAVTNLPRTRQRVLTSKYGNPDSEIARVCRSERF